MSQTLPAGSATSKITVLPPGENLGCLTGLFFRENRVSWSRDFSSPSVEIQKTFQTPSRSLVKRTFEPSDEKPPFPQRPISTVNNRTG